MYGDWHVVLELHPASVRPSLLSEHVYDDKDDALDDAAAALAASRAAGRRERYAVARLEDLHWVGGVDDDG